MSVDEPPEAETEIESQPLNVPEDAAVEMATSGLLSRLKLLATDRTVIESVRRFKPFYRFDAELRKKFLRGDDIVHDGMIVVDASTGIARPILDEYVETTTTRVPEAELLECDINEEEALRKARRQRLETQRRDGGEITLSADADIIYKPVWLVEFADGRVKSVDATDGEVYDDMTLI